KGRRASGPPTSSALTPARQLLPCTASLMRQAPDRSSLDRRPCLDPVVVVLAVRAPVAAIGHWRLPVVDPLPEARKRGVVLVAELRVRGITDDLGGGRQRGRVARLALRGGLAEELRHLRVRLRGD